jgi:NAD(P)H dehydrogenase (quinone)
VRLLLEHGHRVRALVHTVDGRASRLAEQGAEIVAADLLDFSAVSSAMRGVTAAYLCYPITPGLVDVTAIFAQAASEAGVHAVVNMSQISARREAKSDSARALDFRADVGPRHFSHYPLATHVLYELAV